MILVTGATGLVGSHLLEALAEKGETVKALYRSSIPSNPFGSKVSWVKADILDVVELEEAMQGVTEVYHCAGLVSFHKKDKATLHQINVEGTANVVNACINTGVRKLLFVSSVAALGRIRENEAINESMTWSDSTSNSEYGKTKWLAEMEVWRGMAEGLNVAVVNPVIILGASDWTKGSAAIFKSAYDEFPWYTEGMSGFVDVLDVVDAMILLMQSDIHSQKFIISGANIQYKNLFGMIANAFQKRPPHRKVSALLAEIVWRMEAVKSLFTGKSPLLTKETSKTARALVRFDNSKFLKAFPDFHYRDMQQSVNRICHELAERYLK